MSDFEKFPVEWNAEAHIACVFSFQCPQLWDRLQCTGDPLVRHCLTCKKAVHLVMKEEDFERYYKEKGNCVAVPIIPYSDGHQTISLHRFNELSGIPDKDISYDSDGEED